MNYETPEKWDDLDEPVRDNGGTCLGCGRIMSIREEAEQGMCNDCNGGAS